MIKQKKRIISWVVAVVMMFSLLPILPAEIAQAQAGDYVTLAEMNQKTGHYKLPENVGDSYTLTVTCTQDTTGMHFFGEILDVTDESAKKYFTTVSNVKDAWFANCTGSPQWDAVMHSGLSDCVAGNIYEVTYVRGENNSFEITYSNYTTGQTLATYTATNTGFAPAYTCARIKNQGGIYNVYEGSAEENGFSAENNTVSYTVKLKHGVDRTKVYTEEDTTDTIPEGYDVNEASQGSAKKGEYNKYFLKEEIQTINIKVDNNNLNYLLQNAGSEPYVLAESVTIGDTTVKYPGLKTKGNVSLQTAFNDTESDRFSFTVNFGKYVKKKKGYSDTQNFYGCSKVSFNAMASDSTMMHEYNAMRLMDEMGLPTPAYGMAKLYINDRYYGPYFMIEAMDNNILKRYQGSSEDVTDYLVKPNYTTPYYLDVFDEYKTPEGTFTMDSLSSILYEDSEGEWQVAEPLTQISGMWENDSDTLQDVAEMIPTMLTWVYRITCLSKGTDYAGNTIDVNSAEYMSLVEELFGDADQALKYFAAHSFVIQMDNMFTWRQNFALHIGESGKATIVPWDYDLAWGSLGEPNTAEEIANWDYDIMYNDVNPYCNQLPSSYEPEEYYKSFVGNDGYNVGTPLFNIFFQNDSFREKYHNYMEDCSKITSLGGTTTEGKTYEAGRFYSTMMNILFDKMVTASGETLADNVYYMNGIQHPAAITSDMPKLAKLISQRAVGVWLQVNGIDSKVCAGETDSGKLTIVDAATGIFASATYDKSRTYPALTVKKEESTSEKFAEIKSKAEENSNLTIYKLSDAKNSTTGYTVYLPVQDSDAEIYAYDGSTLTKLETKKYDEKSILAVEVSDLDKYIVIRTKGDTVSENGNNQQGNSNTNTDKKPQQNNTSSSSVKKGDSVTVGKAKFKVTGSEAVEYTAPKSKTASTITIPATVKISNKTYKVTSIAANAFKNCKKLKKITIGKNVTKIGKKAFYNCKKLKTVLVKTKKLTQKKVGSKAFTGTPKKAVMKVPKKQLKLYKKIFKKKGFVGKIKK